MNAPFKYYFSNECLFWEKRGALIWGRCTLNILHQKMGANLSEVLILVNTVYICMIPILRLPLLKMITFENVVFEWQFKNFFISWKSDVLFLSYHNDFNWSPTSFNNPSWLSAHVNLSKFNKHLYSLKCTYVIICPLPKMGTW